MKVLTNIENKLNKKYGYLGIDFDFTGRNKPKVITIKHWEAQAGKQKTAYDYIVDKVTNIIAYGGTRGSGKTEVSINGCISLMLELGDKFNGVYLRNKASDLLDIVRRLMQALYREGLKIKKDFSFNSQQKILSLKNGASLRFFYVEGDGLESLQGSNLSHVFLEEPQYFKNIDVIVGKLNAMWRSPHSDVCLKMVWLFNPLGQSTKYLKDKFVDKGSNVFINSEGNKQVFIYATMRDNPKLLESNPNYIKQLENLPQHMRKAWLEGSFDITSGIAFPSLASNMFDDALFKPDSNPWYISLDWGFKDATAVGFYCLYKDSILIKFDELVFNQKTPKEAALIIKTKMNTYNNHNFIFAVADTSIWAETQGASIAKVFQDNGLYFKQATKDREAGYLQLYSLIKEKRILFYKQLKYFWQTVPNLYLSETKQADIETNPKQDDHIYDETRYMVMALRNLSNKAVPNLY